MASLAPGVPIAFSDPVDASNPWGGEQTHKKLEPVGKERNAPVTVREIRCSCYKGSSGLDPHLFLCALVLVNRGRFLSSVLSE